MGQKDTYEDKLIGLGVSKRILRGEEKRNLEQVKLSGLGSIKCFLLKWTESCFQREYKLFWT